MLDVIRSRATGTIAKIILGIVILLFALGGIDTWLSQAGRNISVAEVGNQEISLQAYSNALEGVRERLQAEGQKVDNAMLESPIFKQSVLEGLITKQLINAEIKQSRFRISDKQLSDHILAMPEFQQGGKFSEDLYQKTLEQNRLTATKFEDSIRQDMATQQVRDGLAKLVFVPDQVADNALQLAYQQREVTTAEIKTAEFVSKVKVTPEQVKAYFEKHQDKFKTPEQVKIQFALLAAAALVSEVRVSDEEVKAFYDENADKFQSDEQRQASHILIGFGVGATDKDKQAAKEKALDILDQVKKNPKRFEELAGKYSQDPGSATKGGDLGSFGRGAMVKPFEDAVFSMKPGQISDLVESEFGFHIIRLDGVSGEANSYEKLKPQIKGDLIFQKAQAKYAELAEDFGNTVYEQSGSLDPVTKKFNITLQTSAWLSREDAAKFFKSDKLAAMLFSNEVLKEKRNTEAVEISPNNLVSARVLEYKPSAPRSFDEVKAGIEAVLKLEAALKMAQEQGQATVAKLKSGENPKTLEWIPEVTVDRKNAQGLSDAVMQQVFKMDVNKLPAYAGFADGNRAYVLVKVVRVNNGLADNEEAKTNARREFEQALSTEYISAYAKSLKAKTNITINQKLLSGTAD